MAALMARPRPAPGATRSISSGGYSIVQRTASYSFADLHEGFAAICSFESALEEGGGGAPGQCKRRYCESRTTTRPQRCRDVSSPPRPRRKPSSDSVRRLNPPELLHSRQWRLVLATAAGSSGNQARLEDVVAPLNNVVAGAQ